MNDKKMVILDRLVKDGHIDLAEALVLLETQKEVVQLPIQTTPISDWHDWYKPIGPWYQQPYQITCNTTTVKKDVPFTFTA